MGTENNLLSIGNNFLEVVSPTQSGTAAGRYLKRRQGDGGYMVICQANNHQNQLAVKTKSTGNGSAYCMGEGKVRTTILCNFIQQTCRPPFWKLTGTKTTILTATGNQLGAWAGPGKLINHRTLDFCGVELQCDDPDALANKWAQVLGLKTKGCEIELNNADFDLFHSETIGVPVYVVSTCSFVTKARYWQRQ